MTEKSVTQEGHFEAGVTGYVYRACTNCGSSHPRARGIPSNTCECGQSHPPPEQFDADQTVLTGGGFSLGIANALLKFAAYLNKLAKKV